MVSSGLLVFISLLTMIVMLQTLHLSIARPLTIEGAFGLCCYQGLLVLAFAVIRGCWFWPLLLSGAAGFGLCCYQAQLVLAFLGTCHYLIVCFTLLRHVFVQALSSLCMHTICSLYLPTSTTRPPLSR
jgi:hypothetical protein